MIDSQPPEKPIAFSELVGRTSDQPPKAGIRLISKDRSSHDIYKVQEGVIDNRNYCEQDIDIAEQSGISSKRWNEYLRDKVKAGGALVADGTLIWFPLVGDITPSEEVTRLVTMLKPNLPILATFRFGEKSQFTSHANEISIKSLKPEYDDFSKDLADYFVKSVGESEINALTLYNAGQLNPAFVGSTHEYHRS